MLRNDCRRSGAGENFQPPSNLNLNLTDFDGGLPLDEVTVVKVFSEADFLRAIRRSVDSGIPVLWSLKLGIFRGIPANSQQTTGGHMRMIIGCNTGKNQVLFNDSCWSGHTLKRMDLAHAYRASTGVFTVSPTVR